MDKNIFKLTHSYTEESIIIDTELNQEEVMKLIKIWQTKTWYILDTFDLFPKEMFKILQYCSCQKHKMIKGEKKIELDLYEIWEDARIEVSNDDLITNKNITEEATITFLKIILKELS